MFHTRSGQKVSSHVIWEVETFIEEDTRYKKWCTQDNDASVPFKVGTLGPHTVLPIAIAALWDFPDSHQWSEISSLSKVILVLGKARSCRAPNLRFSEAEPPGWFDVSPKTSARGVMRERPCCCDEATNHQLPRAAAFWIIWTVSLEECSCLMQNLIKIHCSTHPVILNTMATQYTCSFKMSTASTD